MLNRRLHRLVRVYTCQNATLFEITCCGSDFVVHAFPVSMHTLAFLSSADFFQKQLFQKVIQELQTECQTAWIQIRPDILLGLIWVQTVETVCKGYRQAKSKGMLLKMKIFIKINT